ncbi:MAG: septum formation protein Maf [Anaerolineae bacterium]|nr:septum formation protein Maf [Anaerolineae bacterium]
MFGQSPGLILASRSPRRRELMGLLQIPFHAVAADVTESILAGEPPAATAARLAQCKARAVAARHPGALVAGFDTLVALGETVLGKPADAAEARDMLRRMRDRPHTVYSGVTLTGSGSEVTQVAETQVWMRDYTNEELEAYVAGGDPFDKAGGYAIQHPQFQPVARWAGCYANVMGLPLCHLARLLQAWELRPPVDVPAACQRHTGQRCEVFVILQELGEHPPQRL